MNKGFNCKPFAFKNFQELFKSDSAAKTTLQSKDIRCRSDPMPNSKRSSSKDSL